MPAESLTGPVPAQQLASTPRLPFLLESKHQLPTLANTSLFFPPSTSGPGCFASPSHIRKIILTFNLHLPFFFCTKLQETIFRFVKPKDVLAAKLHQEERTNVLSFGLITALIITLYMQRTPCFFIYSNRKTHANTHMKGLNISSC